MFYIINYYGENGGLINAAIYCAAVAAIYIGTGKLVLFRDIIKKMSTLFEEPEIKDYLQHENLYREKLLEILPRLERGLDTMAVMIQVAPLLGLFGTVAGMIKTFSLIKTYGSSNPVILTEGITVSLLTTQAGLLAAFPCMLFHNYVCRKKDDLVHRVITQAESSFKKISGKMEKRYV
ncbi:MAG: MotA/TolQ/ExbB proton channel family protein [Fibrobacterota bacterium]